MAANNESNRNRSTRLNTNEPSQSCVRTGFYWTHPCDERCEGVLLVL